jgi:hypothetical protein
MTVSAAVLEKFRRVLVRQAGGYLRNAVREHKMTCAVCATPAPGYLRCLACNAHHQAFGAQLADAVAPLAYAAGGQQSGYVMRGYKSQRPVEEHVSVVAMMSMLGVGLHTACAGVLAELPVSHWSTVPSLPAKAGPHPLRRLIQPVGPGDEVPLTAATAVKDPRAVDAAHFVAPPLPQAAHVLLVDDTWTRGGHAQSAALALRAAGASRVSVLVAARWVNPEWDDNARWLRELSRDYDPLICPWTGGHCPA